MGVRQLRLVVAAEDYEAAVAFYRDVLGLPEQDAFSGPGGTPAGVRGQADRMRAS